MRRKKIKQRIMGFDIVAKPFVPYAGERFDRLCGVYVVCYRGDPYFSYTLERLAKEWVHRENKHRKWWKKLLLRKYTVEKISVFNYQTKTVYLI